MVERQMINWNEYGSGRDQSEVVLTRKNGGERKSSWQPVYKLRSKPRMVPRLNRGVTYWADMLEFCDFYV